MKTLMNKAWVIALPFAILTAQNSSATQSQCDPVLQVEVQRSDIKTKDRAQSTRDYLCTHSFDEFNNTYGASANASYAGVSGGASYNQGNYKQSQADLCHQLDASDLQSSFSFHTLKDASKGVVEAWQQCIRVRANGFDCWAEPEGGDISFVVHLAEPGNYTVKSYKLSPGASLTSPDELAPGTPVQFGDQRIVVTRADPHTPVSLTINATSALQVKSCRAGVIGLVDQVPPPPKFQSMVDLTNCSVSKVPFENYPMEPSSWSGNTNISFSSSSPALVTSHVLCNFTADKELSTVSIEFGGATYNSEAGLHGGGGGGIGLYVFQDHVNPGSIVGWNQHGPSTKLDLAVISPGHPSTSLPAKVYTHEFAFPTTRFAIGLFADDAWSGYPAQASFGPIRVTEP